MTYLLQEFTAWLDGYLEGNSEPPLEQIKRIRDKLDECIKPVVLKVDTNNDSWSDNITLGEN